MGSRRKSREAVLKALYMSESRTISVDEAFHEMAEIDIEIVKIQDDPDEKSLKAFSLGLDDKQKEFAVKLAHRIVDTREQLNDLITSVLQNWELSRVSRIDRYILWIALAEMDFMLDVPAVVSINEAVELAKKYRSHKSPKFINGILDAAARNSGKIKPEDKEKDKRKRHKGTKAEGTK